MLHHIVLIKVKPSTTSVQIEQFDTAIKKMHNVVPGLKSVTFGKGITSTAHRAKGFQYGLIALLENADYLPGYTAHPLHQVVNRLREEIAEDTLAFDYEEWPEEK